MKYARKNLQKYHDFAYGRAIGASMVTFAIALAVGMLFTLFFSTYAGYNFLAYIGFWALLMVFTIVILILSFASAHRYSIKHMTKKERKDHSSHLGIWILALVVGGLVFTLPAFYFLPGTLVNSAFMPFLFLFSFGGILWVLYLASASIFESFYHEIAFGGVILWVIFALGIFDFGSIFSGYAMLNTNVVLALSAISLVLVFGFVGLMLLINSSRKLMAALEIKDEE